MPFRMKKFHKFLSRRRMIQSSVAALAGLAVTPWPSLTDRKKSESPRIPVLHVTDLYHPPQDPDDQLDLLTIAAIPELDLKGVVLDVTQKFLEAAPAGFDIRRDPGFVPVTQLSYLLGRDIPVAMGPVVPLRTPGDTAENRPDREQAGIRLLFETLEASGEPVVITCTGSARVVTAAFNRNPELLRSKVKSVVLNAGATGGTKREWNVGLDPAAYRGLWQSGLPVDWYPCATERSAFDQVNERGTYWKATQEDLFRGMSPSLRAWIAYSFSGSQRGDIIRVLSETVDESLWKEILSGQRNLWSTGSLAMTANRVLARTSQGWRFLPRADAGGLETWPWRLDPIEASVNEEAQVRWQPVKGASRYRLFGRQAGKVYGTAMAEALNALFKSLFA